MAKRLTGKIAADRVRMETVPRPPAGLIEGFRAVGCDSSLVSDIMDKLGLAGAVPASRLRPTMQGKPIVGPATTVRNIPLSNQMTVHERAVANQNNMAEMEAHNLAEPGDVVVIDGVDGVSNMGGVSSTISKRSGTLGAIIKGGVRDIAEARDEDFPIWASEVTPITGKWRIQTVEINGEVDIFGVNVRPGDIVVADETGVVFIPHERAEEVLKLAQEAHAKEALRVADVRDGKHVADLSS